MAREQLGICAEANLHSSYLLCNVLEHQEAHIRVKLARIPSLVQRIAEHFSEAMLSSVIAISSHYWDCLYPQQRPSGLTSFPITQSEHIAVNLSMTDLLIQVRSDRLDVNYMVLQQIQQLLAGHVELVDLLQGFRYLDGRQLSGFIDAPGNPRGIKRRNIALIADQAGNDFVAGSYLYFFRNRLDLKRWQHLNPNEQEEIMGYSKATGLPLSSLTEQQLLRQQAAERVLQQNMMFANREAQGALHLIYCADASQLLSYWQQWISVDAALEYDRFWEYCQLDMAMAFFVPAVSWLEQAASGAA